MLHRFDVHKLVRVLAAAILGSVFAANALATDIVPQSREQIKLSYAPLVKQTAPAVVNIYTRTIVKERQVNPLFNDPFFQRFFGENFGLQFGQPRERVQNSLGSGVIVDASGTIVTNNHVIEGADKIRIVLSDRREFEAVLKGYDEQTDLAVLQIEADGDTFPFIELGNSDHLQVGDLVLAIGNPFGVGQTVTSGIVSALARTSVGVADIGSFIQTDAAINPGNSGGALVSMDGNLAGINTAIFSKSGGSLGIGFAVPANMIRFVLEGMDESGRVIRPWFGAWGQGVSSDIAESLGLDRPQGVMLNEFWPGSAADRAGLERGDVILDVNGKPVTGPRELKFQISSLPVGGMADLTVLRADAQKKIMVRLEAAPAEPQADTTLVKGNTPFSGMTIANMSPALGQELELDRFYPGVTIITITRGTLAARFGFRPLDRLISVNGNGIASVQDVLKLENETLSAWNISIDRGGKTLNLVIGE